MKDWSRTAEHSAVQPPGCRMRSIVSLQCSLTHPNTNLRCFPPVQHHASKDLTWPRRAPWSSHVGGTETWVADETWRYRRLGPLVVSSQYYRTGQRSRLPPAPPLRPPLSTVGKNAVSSPMAGR